MQITDDARPRLARGVRLQIDCTTGKGVLLYPEGVVELNETAQDILTRCDGKSLGEIVASLAEEYDADAEIIAANVRETISDLQTRNLIELG
jgi:pyrroloquinoline quinone biosynthesis protein D